MSEFELFVRGFIDDPGAVCALTPSSPALAAAMAAQVEPQREGLVLELGPGTGAVTQALLQRGIAPHRLMAIGSSEYFCGLLARRFPAIAVILGDAIHFESHLPPAAAISAIVSGLPLLNLSVPVRRDLIGRALRRLGPRGRFVQLSYSWLPALDDSDLACERKTVWRNFPPAHVWIYRRAGMAEQALDRAS